MAGKPKIWCLFSLANKYDQPPHNLEAWWMTKPSLEDLAKYLAMPLDKATDEEIVKIVAVWTGTPTLIRWDTDYWLEEVAEGGV